MSTSVSRLSATSTQIVAVLFGAAPLTLSTQKSIAVLPSLSVNLKSPPASLVEGKLEEWFSR